MADVLANMPSDPVTGLALLCVVSTLAALGMSADPARILAREFPVRPVYLALLIALVVVPLAALAWSRMFGLQNAELLGLVLMGISPGAPMALRRSHGSGADLEFALVLQAAVAVLAIGAVPLWIAVIGFMYGRDASMPLSLLARQVFTVQLLPLALGLVLGRLAPHVAGRLVPPLLRVSGWLLLAVVAMLVASAWRGLIALSLPAVAASAGITLTALLFTFAWCGPSRSTRMAASIICALRNPGIALLVVTVNGLSSNARVMIIAHVCITAALLGGYLALLRSASTQEMDDAPPRPERFPGH